MLNEFRLTPREKKNMKNDAKKLTSQNTVEISRYIESDNDNGGFEPGYPTNDEENNNENESGWSDFKEYDAVIDEVDEISKRRLDYGDVNEGDVIVLLPHDTDLEDAPKYQFKFNDRVHTTDEGKIPKKYLDGDVIYYYLVGRV